MSLRQLLPVERSICPDDLAGYAAELAAPLDLVAFDPDVLAFCADLATELRTRPAEAPELAALAFWLRPAALGRLQRELTEDAAPVLRVPRGTVLAIPPANVDTVFAYTWLLSLLMGNRTVLRVPSRAGAQLTTLLAGIGRALASAPARVAAATVVVTYGHEDDVTEALSSACDLRIVWGSDETVGRLRAVPLPASARELSFGNRTALCLLDTAAVAGLDRTGLAELARHFVADAYPFDQRACSSPRAVVWNGAAGADAGADVRSAFWAAVAAELDRRAADPRNESSPTAGLDAFATACDLAADRPEVTIARTGTELTVVSGLRLAGDVDGWRARHIGGGSFAETVVHDLARVADLVVRADQTLTTFGLCGDDLAALVAAVGRRGIDRVVPVGSALTFARWWDGVDLVAELTRAVHAPVRPSAAP